MKRVADAPIGEELELIQEKEYLSKIFNQNKGKRKRTKVSKSSYSPKLSHPKTKRSESIKISIPVYVAERIISEIKYPKYRIYNKE